MTKNLERMRSIIHIIDLSEALFDNHQSDEVRKLQVEINLKSHRLAMLIAKKIAGNVKEEK